MAVYAAAAIVGVVIGNDTIANSRRANGIDAAAVTAIVIVRITDSKTVETRSIRNIKKRNDSITIIINIVACANITAKDSAACGCAEVDALSDSGFCTSKTAIEFYATRNSKAKVAVGGSGRVISAVGDPNFGDACVSATIGDKVESFGERTESGRPACAVATCRDSVVYIKTRTCISCNGRNSFIRADIDGGVLNARRARYVGGDANRHVGVIACIGSRRTRG